MNWINGPIAMFDTETTGVDPHRDRIVTAAVIHVGPGIERTTSEWLLNPGIDIPEGAANIHGITTEHAQAVGVEPAGAIFEVFEVLERMARRGAVIVGHNVTYDATIPWAELHRHGMRDEADRLMGMRCFVDTFVLDKWADPYRKGSRRLVDVAKHYGVALSEQEAHGAKADALAAGRVAWHIAQRHPSLLSASTVDELHQWQVEWKREQAESFGKYLVKNGKTDDVAREWPIQPPPADWSPLQLPAPREAGVA